MHFMTLWILHSVRLSYLLEFLEVIQESDRTLRLRPSLSPASSILLSENIASGVVTIICSVVLCKASQGQLFRSQHARRVLALSIVTFL
jgi:hypothetical protein